MRQISIHDCSDVGAAGWLGYTPSKGLGIFPVYSDQYVSTYSISTCSINTYIGTAGFSVLTIFLVILGYRYIRKILN